MLWNQAWKFRLLFCLLVISAKEAVAQMYGDCATPNYQPGKCIPLSECTQIYNHLQRSTKLTDVETNYLKRSQCGNVGAIVLICCTESMRRSRAERTTTTTTTRPRAITPTRNLSNLPQPPVCGNFLSDRIFNGKRTSILEYPWLALLYFTNTTNPNKETTHLCGGSLINERFVLTAAHCVASSKENPWRLTHVRLGEWDTQSNPDCVEYRNHMRQCITHLDMTVDTIHIHPNYSLNSRSYHNDIALLRLTSNVAYTESIQPICLPLTPELRSNDFTSRKVDVAGWGATETQSYRRSYRRRYIDVQQTQMCASGSGIVDSCNGDSGGPLILEDRFNGGDYSFQVGIVSIGPECGSTYYPGIYTRVGEFMNWINEIVD